MAKKELRKCPKCKTKNLGAKCSKCSFYPIPKPEKIEEPKPSASIDAMMTHGGIYGQEEEE